MEDAKMDVELTSDEVAALIVEVEEIFEAIRHGEMEGEIFEF